MFKIWEVTPHPTSILFPTQESPEYYNGARAIFIVFAYFCRNNRFKIGSKLKITKCVRDYSFLVISLTSHHCAYNKL